MFTQKDLQQFAVAGIQEKTVASQVERFKKGFPWMKIVGAATPKRGITVLSKEEEDEAIAYVAKAKVAGKCKFVPASGAASRMFKDIFSGLDKLEKGESLPADAPVNKLAANIEKFAFYREEIFGKPEKGPEYARKVAATLLLDAGLGYGAKPKGVLDFHRYENEVRTPFAEHLVEAQDYMRNEDGSVTLCVTISPEHRPLFEAAFAKVKDVYEKKYGVKYDVEFTYQDKSTDTIAVDLENKPFRTDDGKLLFRPAGHGALIYNLGKVKSELVSIKNIDNVSMERMLPVTARYKKVLMGKCLQLRDTIFGMLREFDAISNPLSPEARALCDRVEAFLDRELCIQLPLCTNPMERFNLIRSKLDRPIRVCGMVKNEGEPGGGPFIIAGKDGSTNLQILESVQINKQDPQYSFIMSQVTHFNPVDLVCCLNRYNGEKFDLLKYVDEDAGFMSSKSYQGRDLKALELPGLWNGAMSDWNTIFVEVPLDTFNPVKVVLDLLRPAHQ
ncbi:MAG: DUF4301 family protein [Bacteroidales bacterium]|nr:DUF4301 family protein [Bacteroidales bacterium]